MGGGMQIACMPSRLALHDSFANLDARCDTTRLGHHGAADVGLLADNCVDVSGLELGVLGVDDATLDVDVIHVTAHANFGLANHEISQNIAGFRNHGTVMIHIPLQIEVSVPRRRLGARQIDDPPFHIDLPVGAGQKDARMRTDEEQRKRESDSAHHDCRLGG